MLSIVANGRTAWPARFRNSHLLYGGTSFLARSCRMRSTTSRSLTSGAILSSRPSRRNHSDFSLESDCLEESLSCSNSS